ncbi:hypothetical protein LMH87_001645 [Akanthomyces muscarius]|uniref:GED domain-containing protein n=1 Tax=Akanthomyces muscarius TaxID=2231603 RepID=A0A9W8UIE8_AKAMU|nr:hypothetical protein LMH87_001645 [Akanthomyces muscarius]KAJ4147097.1 hypothetical protein LMH87_001645 [Akanthomyces muscarius]
MTVMDTRHHDETTSQRSCGLATPAAPALSRNVLLQRKLFTEIEMNLNDLCSFTAQFPESSQTIGGHLRDDEFQFTTPKWRRAPDGLHLVCNFCGSESRFSEKHIEVDMERYGGELAVDYMEAYYKLASKKFVDDISVLAVERCLINKLPSLFPSGTILDLRDDEVAYIARESDTLALERSRYGQKLATLEDAKTDLKQLDIHRALDLASPLPEAVDQVFLNKVPFRDRTPKNSSMELTQELSATTLLTLAEEFESLEDELVHALDVLYETWKKVLGHEEALQYVDEESVQIMKTLLHPDEYQVQVSLQRLALAAYDIMHPESTTAKNASEEKI